MSLRIHREASFKKSLDTLARGDRTASQAAARAEEIMGKLASGDSQAAEVVTRRTKHGELRIHGCRKYNLGGGYRLVCIKQQGYLIAACVGSHDDCNRWIENNRGFEFEPEFPLAGDGLLSFEKEESDDHSDWKAPESEPDYDDILMNKIDEEILRRIFTGICGQP